MKLLARRQLREIINAKGVDRAERLGELLGLGSLATTWTTTQKHLCATATILTSPEALDGRLSDVVDKCQSDDSLVKITTLTDLSEAIKCSAQKVLELSEADRDLSAPMQTPGVSTDTVFTGPPAPPAPDRLRELVDELRRWESTPAIDATADPALIAMLEAFRKVATVDTLCPGCNGSQVTAPRLATIDTMLAADNAYRTRQKDGAERRDHVNSELRLIKSVSLTWVPRLSQLHDQPPRTADPHQTENVHELASDWMTVVNIFESRLQKAKETPSAATVQSVVEALDELNALRHRACEVVEQAELLRRTQRAMELDDQARDPQRIEALYQFDHAEEIGTTLLERRKKSARAESYRTAAGALKKKLENVTEKRFQELAAPINKWLTRLAPDETPQVRVDAQRTAGRAALKIHIEGGNVTAIGRMSDSQLDMLGLAAHLAILELEAPGQPVFIDDPTDMLDHVTRDKLANAGISRLLGQAGDTQPRQVVVLTHDDQLVQSLWYHHGRNTPCTMQAVIEIDRTGIVPQAVITPRSPEQYLTRVDTLISTHVNSGNRIWLRNAAGNLTRQALELIVKDLLIVIGPRGHGYIQTENHDHKDTRGVGKAFEDLERSFRRITELHRQCRLSRHTSALLLIDKLTDSVDRRKEYLLDEASHANFTFPSISQIKTYVGSLRVLAASLATTGLTDEWSTTCNWYTELALCDNCQPYPETDQV